MRVFRLPPQRQWDFRSSGILRNVELYFLADVSGQHIGPNFKGRSVQEEWIYLTQFKKQLLALVNTVMNLCFHRGWGISCLVDWLLDSQEELCYLEFWCFILEEKAIRLYCELKIENPLRATHLCTFVHTYSITSFDLIHKTANLYIANALSYHLFPVSLLIPLRSSRFLAVCSVYRPLFLL